MNNPFINQSISHGTLKPEHLLEAFTAVLGELLKLNPTASPTASGKEVYKRAKAYLADIKGDPKVADMEEIVVFLNEDLFDALDKFSIGEYHFGAHIGDGSDFGFWAGEDV